MRVGFFLLSLTRRWKKHACLRIARCAERSRHAASFGHGRSTSTDAVAGEKRVGCRRRTTRIHGSTSSRLSCRHCRGPNDVRTRRRHPADSSQSKRRPPLRSQTIVAGHSADKSTGRVSWRTAAILRLLSQPAHPLQAEADRLLRVSDHLTALRQYDRTASGHWLKENRFCPAEQVFLISTADCTGRSETMYCPIWDSWPLSHRHRATKTIWEKLKLI